MKFFSSVVMLILSLTGSVYSQWIFEGAWPDATYKGGTHGLTVDPDGKVWTSSFFKTNWNGIDVAPLLVFNSDGSFVDTIYTVTGGGTTDTLGVGPTNSGCRGLATDEDGNILYVSSSPSKIIKINSQTFERMGSRIITNDIGSSPTAPSVSSDGTIFVGPVIGGWSNPIVAYDSDLNFINFVVSLAPAIGRTLEISADGLKLYWMPFTSEPPQIYLYERWDLTSEFVMVDSLLRGMSAESSTWHPTTNLLWVSHDGRLSGAYTHLTWYGYNINSNTIADSFTLPSPITPPDPFDELPRGIAFSPDGNTAYVGLFGPLYDRIYKFSKFIPVELTSFTAIVEESIVHLQWITASEINNHGFEIERSYDNVNFFTIGFVDGNGTTTEQKAYHFKDSPSGKIIYYRLKQVDYDGSYEYSNTINVDVNEINGFLLSQNFPNPFNPITTIYWQSPINSWQTLKVYDVLGREVTTLVDEYRPAGSYEIEFNASQLSSGTYFYKLQSGEYIQTKKLSLLK